MGADLPKCMPISCQIKQLSDIEAHPESHHVHRHSRTESTATANTDWSFDCDNSSLFVFDDPVDPCQLQHTLQTLLSSSSTTSEKNPTKTITLSQHRDNAIITSGWNDTLQKRTILRVTRCAQPIARHTTVNALHLCGRNREADRLMLFGGLLWEERKSLRKGIIAPVCPPRIVHGCFLVEQFEDVTEHKFFGEDSGTSGHMDLELFVELKLNGAFGNCGLSYLHDALKGLGSLHEAGWVHLNFGPKNIVLSNNHGYLIDFKNALPFITLKKGRVKRKELEMTMLTAFLPPEHFVAKPHDEIHLPSYDAWAFGATLFHFLFRRHLFSIRTVTNGKGKIDVDCDRSQIDYYFQFGFPKFLKRYHLAQYILLYESTSFRYRKNGKRMALSQRKSLYLKSCGDLFQKIFRRPNKICSSRRGGSVFYCPSRRLSVDEICQHSFWKDVRVV